MDGGYKLSLLPVRAQEQEPQEQTARPGNAQRHAMWLMDQPAASASDDNNNNDDNEAMHRAQFSVTTPGLSKGLSRPLNQQEQDRLAHLDRLKFFLATAPSGWEKGSTSSSSSYTPDPNHPALNRFLLPSQEFVTCVLWNGLYHITGTDIVRALVFRFEAFGRPVRNMKKFEEGVFSDLRNLKPGVDACLEEPKSPFLDLLFKYQCIRTQKKQKVFYWFSVPHDRLFLDALERDLKREKMGMEATTVITGEPGLSFTYDKKRSLYEQFTGAKSNSRHGSSSNRARRSVSKTGSIARGLGTASMREGEGELEWNLRRLEEEGMLSGNDDDESEVDEATAAAQQSPFFSMFSLFEGSPTYKQRRKKANHGPSALSLGSDSERGRSGFPSQSPQVDDPMTGGMQVKRESANAADMFMKQAHGELGQSLTPSSASLPKVDMRDVGVYVEGRLVSGGTPTGPVYPQPFDAFGNYGGVGQAMDITSDATASAATSGSKTKVFVCPLLSCGRMFKRMEHLKRHLRTHTLERPFVCDKCGKKFSRSDNLGQHMRVHGRAESQGGDPNFSSNGDWPNQDWGDWINSDGEEGSGQEDEYASNRPSNGLGLGMYSSLGMGMGVNGEWTGTAPGSAPAGDPTYGLDMGACEIELPAGDVREVPGDEEGLLAMGNSYPQQTTFQSGNAGYYATTQQQQQPHQPPPPLQQHWVGSAPPASAPITMYGRHPGNSSAGSGSLYGGDPVGDGAYLSMSAPSHKQTFDHTSLYPPGIMDNAPGSGGPVRRHRSMTPSLIRSGSGDTSTGPVRSRPGTASGDSPVPRGFHPYAHTGYSSTQSSPSMYPVGLPGSLSRRSSSRASSTFGGMEEQMRQMMRSDSGGSSSRPGSALSLYGNEMYRTDSPGSLGGGVTDSPAHFAHELPQQTQDVGMYHAQHAQTVPVTYDKHENFYDGNGQGQYVAGGAADGGGGGYQYAHPQHVSTI